MQPAGYGSPAQYGQHRRPGFEPKLVNPLDWAAMGAGVLALIFSFFAYYTYDAKAPEVRTECARPSDVPVQVRGLVHDLCSGTSAGAWHGFFGWFGVLLGLFAAGLVAFTVFVSQAKPAGRTRLVALAAAGLGLVSTLIALAVVPDWPALKNLVSMFGGSYSSRLYHRNIADGHGFSYWIVLILLGVLTVVTFLRMQQTRGAMPALSRGTRPAGDPGYAPSPGYGQSLAPPAAPPQQQLWAEPQAPPQWAPPQSSTQPLPWGPPPDQWNRPQ
ncbi:MAG TPA: hypothetical protein VE442_11175 [Jatrophihabitans sp.]|nr:hypothetical protein [Jatrophihabitans sp.]